MAAREPDPVRRAGKHAQKAALEVPLEVQAQDKPVRANFRRSAESPPAAPAIATACAAVRPAVCAEKG